MLNFGGHLPRDQYFVYILLFIYTGGSLVHELLYMDSLDRSCLSPNEVFRHSNFIPIFTSYFYADSMVQFFLELGSLILLLRVITVELVVNKKVNENPNTVVRGYLVAYIIISFLLFIGLLFGITALLFYKYDDHSYWISHLYHDCRSGISPILMMLNVWYLTSSYQSGYWSVSSAPLYLFASTTLTAFASSFRYRFAFQNILALLVGVMVSYLFRLLIQRRTAIPDQPSDKPVEDIEMATGKPVVQKWSRFHFKSIIIMTVTLLVVILFLRASKLQSTPLEEPYFWKNSQVAPQQKVVIAMSSVPRPDTDRYLITTIESILQQWPVDDYSRERVAIVVVNHSNKSHTVFDAANQTIGASTRGGALVSFHDSYEAHKTLNITREQVDEIRNIYKVKRLRYHFSATLSMAYHHHPDADWIGLHEDDFLLCPRAWSVIRRNVQMAAKNDYCSLFVGTGGAGIFMKRAAVPEVIANLLDFDYDRTEPADVSVQNCLAGRYAKHCRSCQSDERGESRRTETFAPWDATNQIPDYDVGYGMLISSNLLFAHIGYESSLSHGYYSPKDPKWSCDWRQPLNGKPDVTIVHPDMRWDLRVWDE